MLKSQKMNLDYIRTFVVVGQSHNLSEASQKMGVTPSYVSRHVQGLEEELGVSLLVPTPKNKPLQLTDAGEYYFERYVQIYNTILGAEKEYLQNQNLDNCKITIGISQDLVEKYLKPKIKLFSQQYPNITFKIIHDEMNDMTTKLSQYSLDFIIGKEKPKYNSKMITITSNVLGASNYCLVYNKDYVKNIDNLEELYFVLPVSKTNERNIIEQYFTSINITPKIKLEVENTEQVLSYVKEGFGVGIVLKDAIKKDDNLSFKNIDIENNIYISYIKEKLAPSTKEFLKMYDIEL